MISKQLIADNFSKSSSEYESVALCQNYAAGRFAGMIADRVENKESELRILEVGCGTGFLTKTLIGLFPHATITVCDISMKMLETCKHNTSTVRQQHKTNIEFVQCDISNEPINGEYDLVVSGLVFQWLEKDLKHVISKISKQLLPGGNLMFSTLVTGTFKRLRSAFDKCGVSFPGPSLFEREELVELLDESSEVQFEIYKDHYPTVLAFLAQLRSTGAVNATGKSVGPSSLRRVMRQYSEQSVENDVVAEYHLAYCSLEKLVDTAD